MENFETVETSRARMEPNIYGGPECDQHKPRWIVAVEKQGDEDMGDVLTLDAKLFPPGTQIIIKEPLCPKCGEIYENCMVRGRPGDCDFDWKQWTERRYS